MYFPIFLSRYDVYDFQAMREIFDIMLITLVHSKLSLYSATVSNQRMTE